MMKTTKILLMAVLLSLVPVTNVMGQSKRVIKPAKRHKVVKEDTRLRTEEEIKETKIRVAVPGANASSDAAVLSTDRIELPTASKEDDKIFDVTEQQPTFSEGNPAAWLSQHAVYPAEAVGSGVEGRVIVKCVVERDGTLSQVRVVKSLDLAFDKEAVRVVKSMPKWNPAMQNGKPVRCNYTVPVVFKKP